MPAPRAEYLSVRYKRKILVPEVARFQQFANFAALRATVLFEFAVGFHAKGNFIILAAQQPGSFLRCGLRDLAARVGALCHAATENEARSDE